MPKKVVAPPQPLQNKDGSWTVYLAVKNCSAEGTQYKPYLTNFEPTAPIYVAVKVRAEHILSTNPLILTPQGWFTAAKLVATGSVIAAGAN